MTAIANKKIYIAVTLVLLANLIATTAYANHAWGKYHWNLSTADTTADPLDLGDNLNTAAWDASLVQASDEWNASVLKTEIVPGTSNSNCDPTIGMVEVCNGAYGDNGWLGIAQIWAYRGKDGHIAQGVVKVNDTYFDLPKYDSTPWRNLVMCQEVAHTFGLGHQDEIFTNANVGSCMDYTNDPDGSIKGQLSNEEPNAHDLEMLEQIYAHLNQTDPGTGDGGTGNGPGKKGGGKKNRSDVAYEDPADWGQAVAQDAQGKNSVFVRNLDNGMTLLTHVTWTPDHADEHDDHHE